MEPKHTTGVKHSKNEFANGKNHINGIENFWGYAKHRLSKFKGIKKRISYFILKSANLDVILKLLKPIRYPPSKKYFYKRLQNFLKIFY